MHILAQTHAALSPVEAIQMFEWQPKLFSIPGLPTDTAPTTNAIGFLSSGVPFGDSSFVYYFIVFVSALLLVPTILHPRGK